MTLRIALVTTCLIVMALPAVAIDAQLTAVLASHQRASKNTVRDSFRHPGASPAFWRLKPGQTVVEIAPANGYWTEILAPYLKATGGHYIAAEGKLSQRLPAKFADQSVNGDIGYTVFSKSSAALGPAGSADLVLVARNIHDWMWTPGYAEKGMAELYALLKPSGFLAVEEHRADPRPQIGDARDGYVATAMIVSMAEKAGFVLEARSEINANPKTQRIILSGFGHCRPRARAHLPVSPTIPASITPNTMPLQRVTT